MAVWDAPKPRIAIGIPYETRCTVMWAMRMLGPLIFTPVTFCEKVQRMCRGLPLDIQRDMIVEMSLADPKITHILWVDTDNICETPNDPNKALEILLSLDKPIVSGLYYAKQAEGLHPAMWMPAVEVDTGKKGFTSIKEWTGNWLQVATVGMGFCLTKREVFEKIKPPWFPWEKGGMSEDFAFCTKAKQAGFDINVFTEVRVGHIGDLIVHGDGKITTLEV